MESSKEDVFKVKWTTYKGYRVPFLLQNTDGECPLICLSNVLLLKRKFELPNGCKTIGFHSLCSYICSTLPHANSEWVTSILKSLRKGLIFNCRFDSTKALIESDPEQLFLSFEVPIKHGWIADPLVYGVLSKYNYDKLLENLAIYQSKDSDEYRLESDLEKMSLNVAKEQSSTSVEVKDTLSNQPSEDPAKESERDNQSNESLQKDDLETKEDLNNNNNNNKEQYLKDNKDNPYGLVENKEHYVKDNRGDKDDDDDFDDVTASLAIEFLERYATQITEYGIKVLKHEIGEDSLVALYRNNHFLVATMHQGQLFTLVTDSSFYEHGCVWESLETCEYFDENFNLYLQKVKQKPVKKQNFVDKFKKAFKRKPKHSSS